ncbi:MAG: adenylate kinase [Spirochaetes bacterium]|nr:adenylate kinase [Spirochaetota bacterium]
MHIILLGAPGAGKGTIAKMLVDAFGIVQISTGDILRQAVKEGSEVGKKAAEYMNTGRLVPDSIIMDIIEERISQPDCEKGFIFDGFPRTIPQAQGLEKLLEKKNISIDAIINLEVPEAVVLRRLASRRTCSNPSCQAIYNIYSMPPKKEGICDKCGSSLMQRDDETEDAIKVRLATYYEKTQPLIDYYKENKAYFAVPSLVAQETFNEIVKRVKTK